MTPRDRWKQRKHDELRKAAQKLTADAMGSWAHQAHEITLRDVDGNADPETLDYVTFAPLGNVLLIRVVDGKTGEGHEVFVSLVAFTAALPSFGISGPVVYAATPLERIVR